MTAPSHESHAPLQIQKACPKSWDELTGAGKQRFCSSCSLHVHDAVQLTRKEAETIVSSATSRVCMRLQYDAAGQPIYSDTRTDNAVSAAREPQRVRGRLARWAVSAAAGLLAACHGGVSDLAPSDPAGGTDGAQPPSRMGKVCTTKIGDVAMPLPQGIERLGEVSTVPAPTPEPSPTPAPTSPPPPDTEPAKGG